MFRTSCCVKYEMRGPASPPCLCSFHEGGFLVLYNIYYRENSEVPARYMWSYSAVPELNSQHRWGHENLDMDVCDSNWDIGEHNVRSTAEWRELRVKYIWLLSSQDKGKVSYVLTLHQENFAINKLLRLCRRNKAARVKDVFLQRFCYTVRLHGKRQD